MADTGFVSPGSGTSEDRDGKAAWGTPNNILASEGTTANGQPGLDYTDWLRASNFGFAIPTGATIDGVEVTIERRASGFRDDALYLFDGSANIGNNKADTATGWTGSDLVVTYGGAADLWGATLTPAIINGSGFGLRFSVFDTIGTGIGRVDHVQIKVYYTEGGGATFIPRMMLLGVGA